MLKNANNVDRDHTDHTLPYLGLSVSFSERTQGRQLMTMQITVRWQSNGNKRRWPEFHGCNMCTNHRLFRSNLT